MTTFLPQRRVHPFIAATGGAALAVSLVTGPPQSAASAAARVESHAVQLQAIAATQAMAVINPAGAAEAVSVIGPVTWFASSLGGLWDAVFPSAPAAAAATIVATPDVSEADVPQPESAATVAATATPARASGSASATGVDLLAAVVNVGTSLLRAIAWIPIAAVFTPLWVAAGYPGPASGLQPWEPGSDCPGSGAAFGCFLRSVAYGLVAAPYYAVAQSVQDLVETIIRPARVASSAAQTPPPVAPAADGDTPVVPRESAEASPENRERPKRRDVRRSGSVAPASAVGADTRLAATGSAASEKAAASTERRSGRGGRR